ncbi:hypothetical protein QE152_g10049 [Popillia japonica]|uniref:Uncharacterized protein n=1 Tax=Popillia japonica TaxID=7064 RepID=A0AAW1LVU2_POPJA
MSDCGRRCDGSSFLEQFWELPQDLQEFLALVIRPVAVPYWDGAAVEWGGWCCSAGGLSAKNGWFAAALFLRGCILLPGRSRPAARSATEGGISFFGLGWLELGTFAGP